MRAFALLLALPLLAGCSDTDWGSLMNFGSPEAAQVAAVASQAPPADAGVSANAAAGAQPAPNALCLGVARKDATENGFDTATQQRVALRSYQQCAAIFGSNQ